MGKNPADRMKALLGKLHSITISKNRGSRISKEAELLFNKFVKQVDKIFKNLPKPLEWQSFYIHDLPLLVDFCEEVQEVSIQPRPWPSANRVGPSYRKQRGQIYTIDTKLFILSCLYIVPPTGLSYS